MLTRDLQFVLIPRVARVHISTSFLGDWTFKVFIGPGAGYVWTRVFGHEVCGRTLWVANSARSQTFGYPAHVRYYQRHFSLGCTYNANRVPYTRH